MLRTAMSRRVAPPTTRTTTTTPAIGKHSSYVVASTIGYDALLRGGELPFEIVINNSIELHLMNALSGAGGHQCFHRVASNECVQPVWGIGINVAEVCTPTIGCNSNNEIV